VINEQQPPTGRATENAYASKAAAANSIYAVLLISRVVLPVLFDRALTLDWYQPPGIRQGGYAGE